MTETGLHLFSGNPRLVMVPRECVARFNAVWPCSPLSASRHYWFEFDADGDLIDCDVPEHSDGAAAVAMADDCREFFLDGVSPAWDA